MNEEQATQRVVEQLDQTVKLFQPPPRLEQRGPDEIKRLGCSDVGSKSNGKVTISKGYWLHGLDLSHTREYFAMVRKHWTD